MQMFGNTSQTYSTLYPSQQSLKTKSFVSMEDFLQASIHLSRSNNLIEFKKCLMKVLCVTFFGQIRTIDADGVSLQEVLATLLVKTFQSSLITQTT